MKKYEMEVFHINKDNTVDVVIDITTNNIVTLSPDLFEEVSFQLSKKDMTDEQVEDLMSKKEMREAAQLTEEESDELDNRAEWQKQADRDAVERDLKFDQMKEQGAEDWHEGNDDKYDNAKQDGLI